MSHPSVSAATTALPVRERCEHYDQGPAEWRNDRPRPTDPTYCLAPAEPGTTPPRCAQHRGTVTGRDELEQAETDRTRT
jgi:hypothetical protein